MHHLNQLLRDGQSQSGATILAGSRSVCLRERLEQISLRIFADANARIDHAETNEDIGAGLTYFLGLDDNFAVLGELYGVAN